MSDRATAPVVAVALLLAVSVATATVVGALVLDRAAPADPPPRAAFSLRADASGSIALTHLGGDPVDPDTLRMRVMVDGEPIAHQPPVPFFAARGFESGPTGAFNGATRGPWRPGETATLRLAGTNTRLREGSTVTVRLWIDGSPLARLEARVG
ncbi:type IV pilin [Halomarina pelagica]|uniref:type IV pilin n=1 Tax=Halomarina pelagica TaxID=2961599 RepID=UPI0020C24B11|nr:type IV pilin [Halomarina sp. BND7]